MNDTLKQHTHSRLIAASKVEGVDVFNGDDEMVGTIKDIYLDKESGQAEFVSVAFGGVLGVGARYHPVPWSKLKYDNLLNGFVIGLHKEVLGAAPHYDDGELQGHGWRDDVTEYYTEHRGR